MTRLLKMLGLKVFLVLLLPQGAAAEMTWTVPVRQRPVLRQSLPENVPILDAQNLGNGENFVSKFRPRPLQRLGFFLESRSHQRDRPAPPKLQTWWQTPAKEVKVHPSSHEYRWLRLPDGRVGYQVSVPLADDELRKPVLHIQLLDRDNQWTLWDGTLSRTVVEATPPSKLVDQVKVPEYQVSYLPSEEGLFVPIGPLTTEEQGALSLSSMDSSVGFFEAGGVIWSPQLVENRGINRPRFLFAEFDQAKAKGEMATRPAFQTLSPTSTPVAINRSEFIDYAKIYERATPLPLTERFVAYRLSLGATEELPISIPDLLTSPNIAVETTILGLNTLDNGEPDHFADLSLNGSGPVDSFAWEGRTAIEASFTTQLDELPSGPGAMFSLRHEIPSTPSRASDLQNLDTVTLSWTGVPYLDETRSLKIDLAGIDDQSTQLLTVGGFPEQVDLERVAALVRKKNGGFVRLTGLNIFPDGFGGSMVELEVRTADAELWLSYLPEKPEPRPLTLSARLPEIPDGTLRGIYVAPESLHDSLQPLLDHRGDKYLVLTPQAAYNAFSYGVESPEAIRQALIYLFSNAEEIPVLPEVNLVGHASFDRNDLLGLMGSAAQVPTFVEESIDTGFTIENSIDFNYGLLFGDDEIPDAQVGRLPVKNAEELDVVVDRILAAEEQAFDIRNIRRPGLFISDDDPAMLLDVPYFQELWDRTKSDVISQAIDRMTAAEVREGLLEALEAPDKGPSLVLYTGHGNNTFWASERLLTSADVQELNNPEYFPIVATFTCLNGYYAFPGAPARSLGEEWILQPERRGALAAIVPASVDFYTEQRLFIEEFLEVLGETAGTDVTVGEVLTLARIRFAITWPDFAITNREYLLFGDTSSPFLLSNEYPKGVDQWYLD